jgi:hypothetical protein
MGRPICYTPFIVIFRQGFQWVCDKRLSQNQEALFCWVIILKNRLL